MHATSYAIVDRLKGVEVTLPARDDFATGPAESAPIETVLAAGWAPYCLDAARGEMVFAHLSPEIDLAEVPFVSTIQYRRADRVATVPFSDLETLTASLPMPRNLIWVFSIGRTGSTLVSHVFNGASNVWSLSEPGPFGFRGLRASAATYPDEKLISNSVKLLYRCSPAGRDSLAIKLQSQSLFDAERYLAATPDARYIFLYRDALGWISSFRQFHLALGLPDRLEGETLAFGWAMNSADTPRSVLADRFDLDPDSIDVEQLFAASWVLHLDAYRKAAAAGVPFALVRYNDLLASPREGTARLFTVSGLDTNGIDAGLKAFEKDSQEGTAIARSGLAQKLNEEQIARARALIGRQGAQYDPDIIL